MTYQFSLSYTLSPLSFPVQMSLSLSLSLANRSCCVLLLCHHSPQKSQGFVLIDYQYYALVCTLLLQLENIHTKQRRMR
jgi:hypothetical protein